MNWKERAAIFLTDKGGSPVPPKPPKAHKAARHPPLRGLGGKRPPPFQDIKNVISSKKHYSYHFVLRGNEGGGVYVTDESGLDAARHHLMTRYGDSLLLVTKAEGKA